MFAFLEEVAGVGGEDRGSGRSGPRASGTSTSSMRVAAPEAEVEPWVAGRLVATAAEVADDPSFCAATHAITVAPTASRFEVVPVELKRDEMAGRHLVRLWR